MPEQYIEIPLTCGQTTIISKQDLHRISKYDWYANKKNGDKYYAVASKQTKRHRRFISLHRYIMSARPGEDVDHVNGNTLDNRRENLRVATRSQNLMNQAPNRGGSSNHKGVILDKQVGTWIVQIVSGDTKRRVTGIESEEIASAIYDLLAMDRFKEYARLNNPWLKQAWNRRAVGTCGDCKHGTDLDDDYEELQCDQIDLSVKHDFYCAKWEKKE